MVLLSSLGPIWELLQGVGARPAVGSFRGEAEAGRPSFKSLSHPLGTGLFWLGPATCG